MITNPYDRAALALGLLALGSPVFSLSNGSNTNFVAVHGAGLVALVVIGVVAITGALTRQSMVVVVAGAACAVCSITQFAQFGRSTNWLEGSGSTASLLLGLALGLLVVGLARTDDLPARQSVDSP